jgi:glycosyltransferase involved in cell wall biosynthesis
MLGDQITYMESNGYQIHIACSHGDKLENYRNKWNFNFYDVAISRSFSPINDLISIFKIYRYIKKNNIDIVVGHTPKGAFISMIAAFFSKTKKRIYIRHGLVFETAIGLKRKILIFVEKITSNFSSIVICVSKSVFNISLQEKLDDPIKLKILNKGTCNGIDVFTKFNFELLNIEKRNILIGRYNINNTDIIVGFVGRLSKDKGISELIQAWKILKLNNRNIKLMLCGPIDERDPISSDLYNNILNDESIIYCGEIEDTKLYYSIFSFFILPSYREGFPTVVLEASAMKLAVITTKKTGCIDSIIENQTGIFTEIKAQSISDSIQYYINNPEIAKNHGENGRKFVLDNFQQEIIWKEILHSYQSE